MFADTPVHVRYGETDMMGIVYHANYLLYFEDARTHFLEAIGHPYQLIEQAGFVCPIREINVKYLQALRYGQRAFVRTSVSESRAMQTVFNQAVYLEGANPETDAPLAQAQVTCCMVDRATFKPASIKRHMPALYNLYQKAVAEGVTG
jgi:acyl-CoA thioester hydrolase